VASAATVNERARGAALRREIERDERRVADARTKAEVARTAMASPAAPKAKATEPPMREASTTSWADAARTWAREHDRPEAQVRWFEQRRAENRGRYAGLFRQLDLSHVQRERFIRDLSELEERQSDLHAAAQAVDIDLSAKEINKARGELYSELAAAQKALLGETGYRAMQEYDRTASVREAVGRLAGLAAVNGVAFSPAQAEQLVPALAEAVPTYRTGGRASLVDAEPTAVRAALARVLTAEQQAVLATQEATGSAGGLFHARWNAELGRATRAEKDAAASRAQNR
jgi:chromosome segregation ATPase